MNVLSSSLLFTIIICTSTSVIAETLPANILNNLNIHSFNNSLRPRGAIEGDTVRKFGFTVSAENDINYYSLTDKDQSWTYGIKLLEGRNGKFEVCFYDYATPPATYRSIQKLDIILDRKTRLYNVIKRSKTTTKC